MHPYTRLAAFLTVSALVCEIAIGQTCSGYIPTSIDVSDFATYYSSAPAGSVWCLDPGTYYGCDGTTVLANGADEGITLRGAGVHATTIDCESARFVVSTLATSASLFEISNMTITNFENTDAEMPSSGGCIAVAGPFTLESLRFDNSANADMTTPGMAVYAQSISTGPITINNCEFVDVSGGAGGAVLVSSDNSEMSLTNVMFSRCDGTNGVFQRAQASYTSAHLIIANVTVVDCSVATGGIHVSSTTGSDTTIHNYTAVNNYASTQAPGMYISTYAPSSDVYINGFYCADNTAESSIGCMYATADADDFDIYNAHITDNSVSGSGGGGGFSLSTGGASGLFRIHNSYFARNYAAYGGAIAAANDLQLNYCVFDANTASGGSSASAIEFSSSGSYADFFDYCTFTNHAGPVVTLVAGAGVMVTYAYICDNSGTIFDCTMGSVNGVYTGCAFTDVASDGLFTCGNVTTGAVTTTTSSTASGTTTTTTTTSPSVSASSTSLTSSSSPTASGSTSSAPPTDTTPTATATTDPPSSGTTRSSSASDDSASEGDTSSAVLDPLLSGSSTTGVSGWEKAKVPVIVGTSTGGGLCGFGVCFFCVCWPRWRGRSRPKDENGGDHGDDDETAERRVDSDIEGGLGKATSGSGGKDLFTTSSSEASLRGGGGAVELDDVVTTTVPVFGDSQQFASLDSTACDAYDASAVGAPTTIIPGVSQRHSRSSIHSNVADGEQSPHSPRSPGRTNTASGNEEVSIPITGFYATVASSVATDETATVPVQGLATNASASRPNSTAATAASSPRTSSHPSPRSSAAGNAGAVVELQPALGLTTHLIPANLHRTSIAADVKVGVSAAAVTKTAPEVPGLGPASLLGEGGQASVYGALSYSLGKRVVLKVFHDADAYEREVDIILAAGEHDNVVSRLELPDLPPSVLALEFASHGSLNDYTASHGIVGDNGIDRRLSPGDVLGIGLGVARGLAHLHSRGVCHLDLKPDNVLIKPGAIGSVVPLLADFGASFVVGRGDLRVDQCTVRYAAPEVVQMYSQSAEPGIHSYFALDVFSFGMLLWEMAVGERPFVDLATADIIAAIIADPSLRVDVGRIETSELSKLVSFCLVPAASRSDDMPAIVASLEGLSVE